MNALIKLKNGDTYLVLNLKFINQMVSDDVPGKHITEYDSLMVSAGTYIFVGDNILNVEGSDILSIMFSS